MKLKTLVLWAAFSSAFASGNIQFHPSQQDHRNVGCQIDVINNSSLYATVYGTFDDGVPLIPFIIMADGVPQHISLFYNSFCHQNMYLDIVDANGFHLYTKYTPVNTLIQLLPY